MPELLKFHPDSPDRSSAGHADVVGDAQDSGVGRTVDARELAKHYPSLQPLGRFSHLPPIPLHKPITLIGSRRTARIHLNSQQVSRAHALVVITPSGGVLRDLHSREGTLINGKRVEERHLTDGDRIAIASFEFTYSDPRQPEEPVDVPPMTLDVRSPRGEKSVRLSHQITLIGRRKGSDVELPFADVSTANTAVVRLEGFAGESQSMGFVGYALYDLGGKGTERNGRAIHRSRFTADDVLSIGPANLRLVPVPQEAPAGRSIVDSIDDEGIALDEPLLQSGVEEDVLAGSGVMDAIAEPEPEFEVEVETTSKAESIPEPEAEPETEFEPVAEAEAEETAHPEATSWPLKPTEPEPLAQEVSAEEPVAEVEPESAVEDEEAEIQGLIPLPVEEASEVSEVDDSITTDAADEAAPVASDIDADAGEEPDVLGAAAPDALTDEAHEAAEVPDVVEMADVDVEAAEETSVEADESIAAASMTDEPEYETIAFEAPTAEESVEESAEEPTSVQAIEVPAEFEQDDDRSETTASLEEVAPSPGELEEIDLSATDFSGETEDSDGMFEPPVLEAELEQDEEIESQVVASSQPEESIALPLAEDEPETAEAIEAVSSEEPEPTFEPPVVAEAEEPEDELSSPAEPVALVDEEASVAGDEDAEILSDAASPTRRRKGTRRRKTATPRPRPPEVPVVPAMPTSESGVVAEDEAARVEPVAEADAEQPVPTADAGETVTPDIDLAAEEPEAQETAADQPVPVLEALREVEEESVLRATEPTPDSALEMADFLRQADLQSETSRRRELSDSEFLAEMERFETGGSGDLVDAGIGSIESEPSAVEERPFDIDQETEVEASSFEALPTDEEVDRPADYTRRPEEDWRGDWQQQDSAFIGNVSSLDLSDLPRDEDTFRPDATPEARQEPPREADFEETPEAEDRPSPPDRPRKVGFGAGTNQPEFPTTPSTGPFSASPVGGGTGQRRPGGGRDDHDFGPLDPSATMPETSGLIGTADVFSMRDKQTPAIPAFGEAPAQTGTAVADDETETVDSAPANGLVTTDDDAVDGFLRTIQSGVPRDATPSFDEGIAPSPTIPRKRPASPPRPRRARRLGGDRLRPPMDPMGGPLASALPVESIHHRHSAWMVPLLVGLMVVLIIGAAVGIWVGLPPEWPITAKLRYDVPATLTGDERQQFVEAQQRLLQSPQTRESALDRLRRVAPEIEGGFLIDPVAWNRFARDASFSTEEENTLVLQADDSDRADGVARLKAVTYALHQEGSSDLARRTRGNETAARLQTELADLRSSVTQITQDIEELSAMVPAEALDASAIAAREAELQTRIRQLDEQWSLADRRIGDLKRELAELESADPMAADQSLQGLRDELAQIETRLEALRAREDDGTAEGARPAAGLEAGAEAELGRAGAALLLTAGTVEGEDVEGAAVAYIDAVETLTSEVLTSHLQLAAEVALEGQKHQRLRQSSFDRLAAADATFQALQGEQDLKQRQLNAVRSDGLETEIPALTLSLRTTREQYKVREAELSAQADAEEAVAAERRAIESLSEGHTARMAIERRKAQVAVADALENLSATSDDPKLIEAVERFEKAMQNAVRSSARRLPLVAEVWEAEDEKPMVGAGVGLGSLSFVMFLSQDAPPDVDPATLAEQAARLRRQIQQREAELTGERQAVLTRLQQQLSAVEAASAKAQREAQEARAELSALQAGRDTEERQRQKLDELRTQKSDSERRIAELQSELQRIQADVSTLAVPREPSDTDITVAAVEDKRLEYIIYSIVAISLLMLVPIYLSFRAG